jgi:hypothetical protein
VDAALWLKVDSFSLLQALATWPAPGRRVRVKPVQLRLRRGRRRARGST